MDIASVFEVLSQGKIISSNSKKYSEYTRHLMDEEVFDEFYNAASTLGYILHGEGGYYYLSKKGQMNKDEMEAYISKHKDAILAISILRQLRPQLDRGSFIIYTDLIHEYKMQEKEDSSITNRLNMLVSGKGNVDLKSAFDALFDRLKKFDLIESVGDNDQDKYKILDAVEYYIKIIELSEPNSKESK
jgi:hypothetical protein